MDPTPENIAALSNYLAQSLDPRTRRAAEASLAQAERQPGFPLLLLALVQNEATEGGYPVRLAAALFFKNLCRRGWQEDEDDPSSSAIIAQQDKGAIKTQLVPLMLALSAGGSANRHPGLRVQVGEAVALVAEREFPDRWEGLIDQLVASLTESDYGINLGVLQTAHSIFRRWRAAFRSDALYSEINFVLSRFAEPYLALLKRTDALLTNPSTPASETPMIAQSFVLLLQLFYDLSAQDLPPFIEDNMEDICGVLGRWLSFSRPELEGDADDPAPEAPEKIRASICEAAELYANRYLDAFPQLPNFVQLVWEMLGKCGTGEKYDVLVSKAMRFLSTVVKMGNQRELFAQESTLEQLCTAIILPNITIRTADEELFEDNPIEYIRRDLETSTENDTRRKAASDFTRALMENFQEQVTGIISRYIGYYLQEYNANREENWKQKDTAIYLLTSIASRGSTTQHGVSSTNSLVDVVKFFSDHVFQDLEADPASVNPILQVDAIKFLHTFRSQLTKEQLLSVLPLLVRHLESSNYVTCSYAAITIERVLFIKQKDQFLFTQTDVQPFSESILLAMFRNIESGGTPEKIAENDYLMKCVMRVIVTARSALAPTYAPILSHLTTILGEIAKNPSNPRFNQFCFESISALIRFVTAANPAALADFERSLFGPFTAILQGDVVEFIPFVFQILSQMLEQHTGNDLPEAYLNLLPPLLTPALWEQRGNVPALVRLLQAFLARGAEGIVANNQLQALLGIYQKLISSRINDSFGFELLQSIFEHVPLSTMEPYLKQLLMLMLVRLQSSKTDKFTKCFVYFVGFVLAIQREGLTPDFVVRMFDALQPGVFPQLLQAIVLPEVQKIPEKQRKVVAVGLTRLLTQSESMLAPPCSALWPATLEAVLKLFLLPQAINKHQQEADEEIFALDWEDTGFQSTFSKLAASEPVKKDPAAWAGPDARAYLSKQLAEASKAKPGVISGMASSISPGLAQPFTQYMQQQGDVLV